MKMPINKVEEAVGTEVFPFCRIFAECLLHQSDASLSDLVELYMEYSYNLKCCTEC